MTTSSISVAMCTFNGERFLPQQLASILRQTRLPDEVIIRDDRSTDRTPQMIEEFRRHAPFPVDFRINDANLGAKKNFEHAIFACRGDLIALSDQDDIWHPLRLERSQRELDQHPEAGLVFTDGGVINDDDQPTGDTLWKSFRLYRSSLEALQSGDYLPLAKRTFVTGATVMFRSQYAAQCFPTGQHWWHDGWLAMLIAAMAEVRPIDEKLISYRSHASQQLGLGVVEKRRWKPLQERAEKQGASMRKLHASLIEVCDAIERLPLDADRRRNGALPAFRTYRDFLAVRLDLPHSRLRRVPVMLDHVELYRGCAMGILSMARDLVLPAVTAEGQP